MRRDRVGARLRCGREEREIQQRERRKLGAENKADFKRQTLADHWTVPVQIGISLLRFRAPRADFTRTRRRAAFRPMSSGTLAPTGSIPPTRSGSPVHLICHSRRASRSDAREGNPTLRVRHVGRSWIPFPSRHWRVAGPGMKDELYKPCPSSTSNAAPVMVRDASDSRCSTTPSRSSCCIRRRRGKPAISFCPLSLARNSSFSSVAI
jgi:hypothetical protein